MIRVGLGYDIHRFVPGRALVLGGVTIPFEQGLDGHSDADVVVHALMDALLGAGGLGDIGTHFPPGDARFRDASSLDLLRTVMVLLRRAGYRVGNADIMVVAERPRITSFIDDMRSALASILQVPISGVSVKATTNEGLGPEGRGEGISAQAVALLEADE